MKLEINTVSFNKVVSRRRAAPCHVEANNVGQPTSVQVCPKVKHETHQQLCAPTFSGWVPPKVITCLMQNDNDNFACRQTIGALNMCMAAAVSSFGAIEWSSCVSVSDCVQRKRSLHSLCPNTSSPKVPLVVTIGSIYQSSDDRHYG